MNYVEGLKILLMMVWICILFLLLLILIIGIIGGIFAIIYTQDYFLIIIPVGCFLLIPLWIKLLDATT